MRVTRKPSRPCKRDLRADLDVKLEAERLALLELEVVDVRLRRDFELLAVHHFLERFLNQRLDHLLPNRVLEALLHHRRRGLARAEARASGRWSRSAAPPGPRRRARYRRAHGPRSALEAVGFLRRDFDVHEGER